MTDGPTCYRGGMDLLERFYSNVAVQVTVTHGRADLGPCHLWTGRTRKQYPYGLFKVGQVTHRAHLWLWRQKRGPVPLGRVLDHWVCSNVSCVNLDHLRPVTLRENALRSDTSVAATNLAKTHCPAGHPYAGDNLRIRSTDGARLCRTCQREHTRKRDAASPQRRARKR